MSFFIFLMIFYIKPIYSYDLLRDEYYIMDKTCSYHYDIRETIFNFITQTNRSLPNCRCLENYETKKSDFSLPNVQCDYKKKSKFRLIFISIIQPFGFELLYLEYNIYFTIHLLLATFIVLSNLYLYIFSDEDNYFSTKKHIIYVIILTLFIIGWVVKIILYILYLNRDGNEYSLINDMKIFRSLI